MQMEHRIGWVASAGITFGFGCGERRVKENTMFPARVTECCPPKRNKDIQKQASLVQMAFKVVIGQLVVTLKRGRIMR